MDSARLRYNRIIATAVIGIWLVLFINFILRDLFHRKGLYSLYRNLITGTKNERMQLVYGKDLYDFLDRAKHIMPLKSSYALEGVKEYSIDYRRGVYFLYPCVEKEANPDFILVYKNKSFKKHSYKKIISISNESYVLGRIR